MNDSMDRLQRAANDATDGETREQLYVASKRVVDYDVFYGVAHAQPFEPLLGFDAIEQMHAHEAFFRATESCSLSTGERR